MKAADEIGKLATDLGISNREVRERSQREIRSALAMTGEEMLLPADPADTFGDGT